MADNTGEAAEPQPRQRERTWTKREHKGRKKPLSRLWIVAISTAVLIVAGGLIASSTVSVSALQLMLPFFAILAVASIGQHLVIQHVVPLHSVEIKQLLVELSQLNFQQLLQEQPSLV